MCIRDSDISLGRGNANKLLIRFLKYATRELDVRLADINGGGMRNAIPREGYAILLVSEENVDQLKKAVKRYESVYQFELGAVEPTLSFKLEETEQPLSCLLYTSPSPRD